VTLSEGEPHPSWPNRSKLVVTAELEMEVTGKPAEALYDLWSGRNAGGQRWQHIPESLGQAFRSSGIAKREAANAVIALYRWRWMLDVPATPFETYEAAYSLEPGEWDRIQPTSVTITAGWPRPRSTIAQQAPAVEQLLTSAAREPLAHQLLIEAVGTAKSSERVSLMFSVIALEVGLKALIIELQPQTEWILTEMPSPPIIAILCNYLPTLPAGFLIGGKKPSGISKRVIDDVKKAVTLRNNLAHRGVAKIDAVWLDDWLLNCKDLLYLFDVYAGRLWAFDRISVKFQRELASE
jgi:hypothetical protein